MADHERVVDGELSVQAGESVRPGGNRYVMESREVLDVDPGGPMGGEAAGDARLAQLAGRGLDLGPSLRCLLAVEPCGTKQVLVVVEDRGRGIERERQQIARHICIIARYDR